ncbi:MAG: ATP synthase F1 subunit delta [Bacteroidota bacterium]
MSEGRIAARYAKPLLNLAEEKSVLEEVKQDMDSFASLCKENRDFSLMLKSPIIPHKRKAEILKKIFEGKFSDLTLQAFDLITRKNREYLLVAIADEFLALYNLRKGIANVTVTTTFQLESDLRESFKKLATKVTGKSPNLEEEIDPDILGGYVLKFGDKQIDDSVRGRLNDLKLKFNKK